MDLLKAPSFTFALGVVSGLALGYTSSKLFSRPSAHHHHHKTPSTSESPSGLADVLLNTTVEYLLGPNRSAIVEYTATIDHVLMVMCDKNVTSIPVVDLEKRRYLGMLNVLDVVGFLCHTYTAKKADESVAEVLKGNREPFLPLYATSPIALLLHVMTSLANEVPIMGADGQITHVVTRHDLLRFVEENLDALGPKIDANIQSLQLSSSVDAVEVGTSTIDAVKLMIRKGISEVAVVTPDTAAGGGKLVGNLCAADFVTLSVINFSSKINDPASKFMSQDPNSVVTVDPNATLRTVIQKFVNTRPPVLWVVDSSTKPIGCITLKAITKLILEISMQ